MRRSFISKVKSLLRSKRRSTRNKKPRAQKSARKAAPRKTATRKTTTRTRRRKIAVVLIRPEENPIISPRPENSWEAWQTFNPGVIFLDGKVHFLYRAIGGDGFSRFGYAASGDGFTIDERLPYPVYEHKLNQPVLSYYSFASGGSFGGAEDPRIVRVHKEDTLYMTYTACDKGLRVALTSIKGEDFLKKRWKWKSPALISPPGEYHKNWVLFPEKINGKYAILHSISPKISVAYRDSLEFEVGEYIQSYYNGDSRPKNCWENLLRGAGAPPVKTRLGWLLFYHALDENDPGKYKVGAMILDSGDPARILYCAREPVLSDLKKIQY